MAIRSLTYSSFYIFSDLGPIEYEIYVKADYFSLISGYLLILFFYRIFPIHCNRLISFIFHQFTYILIIALILLPSKYFSLYLPIFQFQVILACLIALEIIIKNLKNRSFGASVTFYFILIYILLVFIDIYFGGETSFSPLGQVIFFFSHAYIISKKFTQSYYEAENAKKEIESLSKTKDEFLANLSHEIRTPLSSVYAYSEMLEPVANEPDTIIEYSQEIHSNAKRLNELVEDVILVTDLDSSIHLTKSRINLLSLIHELKKDLDSLSKENEISWIIDIPESFSINVDAKLFSKALIAILKNAILYNMKKGKIFLSIASSPSPKIIIEDTGFGISQEYHSKIFEKFFRVDSSLNYKISGVGIGLYLSQKIIQFHGGTITIDSKTGQGSRFNINLS
jgi:signal transduction histidine kinase